MKKPGDPLDTYWYHRKISSFFRKPRKPEPQWQDTPYKLKLEVENGHDPVDKPPVRIFLGTEPSQYRAERVFVWSIKKVRDPGREYEIYFMSDIKGIDRSGWKTGFTKYRYAIPHWAGQQGRAIYNDVDQIYLVDPAELFDTDMNDAGVLAITEKEDAVMLIDCEKMSKLWLYDDIKKGRKKGEFKRLTVDHKLYGKMDGVWNSREGEYPLDKIKCLHYTVLHTQPWQPAPDFLRYRPNPLGYLWFALEKEADAAGFTIPWRKTPSIR